MSTNETNVQQGSGSGKKTTIIITLVCLGVVLSSISVLVLNFNLKAFAVMFCVYVLAYTSYMFACLMIFRQKLKNDFRYDIGVYMSIFTMFFVVCLAILIMVLHSTPKDTSMSYYPMYR